MHVSGIFHCQVAAASELAAVELPNGKGVVESPNEKGVVASDASSLNACARNVKINM